MIQTIITAGGKGTRLADISKDMPKPMADICGKPALWYQLMNLKKSGITKVLITVGFLGDKIKDYFGDGSKLGMAIDYYTENTPLGTAGALYKLKADLDDKFLYLNADIIYNFDFNKFTAFHDNKQALITLAVQKTTHPNDSTLISFDGNNCVTGWYAKEVERPANLAYSNAAIHLLGKSVLSYCEGKEKVDLDRDLLANMINTKRLFAYPTAEYIEDFGTPERYFKVCEFVKNNAGDLI